MNAVSYYKYASLHYGGQLSMPSKSSISTSAIRYAITSSLIIWQFRKKIPKVQLHFSYYYILRVRAAHCSCFKLPTPYTA